MEKVLHFLTVCFVLFISCNQDKGEVVFTENGIVTINGQIKDPLSKTGMLIIFDAVSGNKNTERIKIDKSGNFIITYNLLHPVFNCTYFDVGNINSPKLLIEPNTTYEVVIENDTLSLIGETAKVSNELNIFYNALENSLGNELEFIDTLYKTEIVFEDFFNIQKETEKSKIDFYNNYCENVPLSAKAKTIIESDIKFSSAHNVLLYLRKFNQFPEKKFKKIINEFPIVKRSDFYVRSCNDYISLIVDVLSENDNNEKLLEFVKSHNYYSNEELMIVEKILYNDSLVRKSEKFKEFNTRENISKFRNMVISFPLNNVFINIEVINNRIFKDMVISQAVSKFYLKFNRKLNSSQWEFINSNISDTLILNYLHEKGNYCASL